jgi:nitrite reductase/ring-hydroxylating ferredoxin subunit
MTTRKLPLEKPRSITSDSTRRSFPTSEVTAGFIPFDDNTSAEFAALENERLWPLVWQIACRLEEIPKVGDFVTYDIVDDSIIVVRVSDTEIKAYHNVCPHRGRQLVEGCGRTGFFKCRFHGWEFNLNGGNQLVIDRGDFGESLSDDKLRLKSVKVGFWGGFVFINMDSNAEPLAAFLAPLDERCGKFEFERLRYRYYKSCVLPCNWKVGQGFFNELYHVQQSHPQSLKHMDDCSRSTSYGRHGASWYVGDSLLPLRRSARLPKIPEPDIREHIIGLTTILHTELGAMTSERSYRALGRLKTDIPADASAAQVLAGWGKILREEADKEGAGWPAELTPEYIAASHVDWQVFPNTIFLHTGIENVLWYRFRPHGRDPDNCILDVWSLERYGEGKQPKLEREFYTDWRDPKAQWGRVLEQDFINMLAVQKGNKSRAFAGAMVNPVQEVAVSNLYRSVRQFINEGPLAGTYHGADTALEAAR